MVWRYEKLNVYNACKTTPPVLDQYFDNQVKVIVDNKPSTRYYRWFANIESQAFREELRYSQVEFEEVFNHANTVLIFVLSQDQPQAVMLGHDCDEQEKCFYLNVIAVLPRGRGIGTFLITWLILTLSKLKYRWLCVDTEEKNEEGQLLKSYYENLGFETIRVDPDGNISLKLDLRSHTSSG